MSHGGCTSKCDIAPSMYHNTCNLFNHGSSMKSVQHGPTKMSFVKDYSCCHIHPILYVRTKWINRKKSETYLMRSQKCLIT